MPARRLSLRRRRLRELPHRHQEQWRALAGGRALATPFGTFYGPNITPDRDIGIGAWSEADFHRALREGIGRDGEYLYPVFPFTSFTGMSDQDIADLYAYIMAQKPVAQPDKPHAVKLSLRLPPAVLAVWRMMFFTPVRWRRSRVRARNGIAGAILSRRWRIARNATRRAISWAGSIAISAYAGNPDGPDHQKAPNITPDHGHRHRQMEPRRHHRGAADRHRRRTGIASAPGMAEVVEGTGKLTDADRHAIAVYIKSLPPRRATGK